MKASDIDDRRFLAALVESQYAEPFMGIAGWSIPHWSNWTDMTERLVDFPEKVVMAKARQLGKRGLIDGCFCGCRGDYTITPAGEALLAAEMPA